MNKAFTKEDDGPQSARLPDLPQSPHPNYVTPAGLQRLQDRLAARRDDLAGLRRAAGGAEVADGGLALAMAERDIRFLEDRINRAIPVNPADHPPGVVAFGAAVEVVDEADRTQVWHILGEDEADPARGIIAPFSPLARALIGAAVGDVVEWARPSGTVDLEITAVRFPDA